MPKRCFLRETKIKLLDGNEYTFRALPFSTSTVGILEALLDDEVSDGAKMRALPAAVEKSLSYDQEPEVVQELMEAGAIPLLETEGERGELRQAILHALVAGFKGGK